LGNVLATITDKKLQVSTNNSSTSYFEAEVKSVQDYYAFGMQMPGRKSSGGYRYGFNGKENDNEVKGEGNQQDYGMRMYDGRIGKFLSVDPLTSDYPWYSPYHFAGNSPIVAIDLDGSEPDTKSWRESQSRYYNRIKLSNAFTVQNQVVNILYEKIKNKIPGDNMAVPRISSRNEDYVKTELRQFVWVDGGIDIQNTKTSIVVPDADGNLAIIINLYQKGGKNYLGAEAQDEFVNARVIGYFDDFGKEVIEFSKKDYNNSTGVKILGKSIKAIGKGIKIASIVSEIIEVPQLLDEGEIPIIGSLIQSNPSKVTDDKLTKATRAALIDLFKPKGEKVTLPVNSDKHFSDHPEDKKRSNFIKDKN
jgi:RHS repeat-associated protein